jgi:hypothetical protein
LPQPPAIFRIDQEKAESWIEYMKKNKSNELKLAVFYAKERMLDLARYDFLEILRKNPQHGVARHLLTQLCGGNWK